MEKTDPRAVVERTLAQPTVCGAFWQSVEGLSNQTALRTKGGEECLSWLEYAEAARRFASGLAALGVKRGDTVALMLPNRPEFHIADAAAMHLGAIPFSIYNSYSPSQIEFLIEDAGCRVCVTEPAFVGGLEQVRNSRSPLEHLVVTDSASELTFSQLEQLGDPDFDLRSQAEIAEPHDVLTLIYTSGTTGTPKGVQITHENVMSAAASFDQLIRFSESARVVSYLPMAHIAERMCSHYLPMVFGFCVTTCPDPRQVVSYLPEVRPTWFFAVPRVFEKLKAAIEAGVESEQSESQKQALRQALQTGHRYVRAKQAGDDVSDQLLADWERAKDGVLSELRAKLGLDKLEALNVGAAPTPPEVVEFFHALGLPLAELWGMSETCGAGTCNRVDDISIGTVGPPSPGVELKLAEDGEVLVRGPVVMPGYRNQPRMTQDTIDADGWLHTGDIGAMDANGHLRLIDRKKEMIISAGGKNMSPANIEAKLKAASPLIGQAVCIGDGRPYNVALIVLDPDISQLHATQHELADASPASLAGESSILSEVQAAVDRANSQLSRAEQIKKQKVLPTDWQPGGEELTPTMKLKRQPISRKYAGEIESLYSEA
jgi:long-subunit acyl-CoA synthetase (AMP-forming)